MTKQEYKQWWHNTRLEARESAEPMFCKYPDALICNVPYFKPFYATTKENMEIKESKQIANALAGIGGQPYPEENMMGYIEVAK